MFFYGLYMPVCIKSCYSHITCSISNFSFYFLKNNSDVLCDLVPFVKFKIREKQPWRSVTLLKVTLLHGCFFTFFWIVRIVPNRGTHYYQYFSKEDSFISQYIHWTQTLETHNHKNHDWNPCHKLLISCYQLKICR